MPTNHQDVQKLTHALLQELRDAGHDPSIGLAIGLQMVRLYAYLVVERTRGDSRAMTEFNDHLRAAVEEIVEETFRFRNERFPLEGDG